MPEDFSLPFWQKRFLLTDSRKLVSGADTLFFALDGARQRGEAFVPDLYAKGVRAFVVGQGSGLPGHFPEAEFHLSDSPLATLQGLAAWHRRRFGFPVVGITGSNGKTVVKEWLFHLLQPQLRVVKSPKSYNSQIGVPLSVWQMQEWHEVAILEAGISKMGEMERLEAMIRPTWGIFTNLGPAHDEGFPDRRTKAREKALLFAHAERVVCCADQPEVVEALLGLPHPPALVRWSLEGQPDCLAVDISHEPNGDIQLTINGLQQFVGGGAAPFFALRLRKMDAASLENLLHALVLALTCFPALDREWLRQSAESVRAVPMRLELKAGIHGTLLVDDAYNNDLEGLGIALDFLSAQAPHRPKVVFLSDLLETGLPEAVLYGQVADLLRSKGVGRLWGVGPALLRQVHLFEGIPHRMYPTTAELLAHRDWSERLQGEALLVKGARPFAFEQVAARVQQKSHGTVLEINLEAVSHNLRVYRSLLRPTTKMMVMVKALAYGSGRFEVASLLQYEGVDYLAVAYTDEGVELRRHGIRLPVMVMNPAPDSFALLHAHQLEPEVFSVESLHDLGQYCLSMPTPPPLAVHLAFDTGMRRLGFLPEEKELIFSLLQKYPFLRVASVFTHLAAADGAEHEAFTRGQIAQFAGVVEYFRGRLAETFWAHCVNSPGITRYPEAQFDMVRLGIGLYGVDPNGRYQPRLRPVATLKTTISQVKEVRKGESVGYSRAGVATRDGQIGTLAIGYADGFDRRMSKGVGKVLIHGQLCPVIGNVCMDMTMVDLTDVPQARAGDEAVVFGDRPTVSEVAGWIGTIPYEVFTNVSERVKRIFFEG